MICQVLGSVLAPATRTELNRKEREGKEGKEQRGKKKAEFLKVSFKGQ